MAVLPSLCFLRARYCSTASTAPLAMDALSASGWQVGAVGGWVGEVTGCHCLCLPFIK